MALVIADLIAPCGGRLCNLVVGEDVRAELQAYAKTLLSIQLSERSVCDLELVGVGAFLISCSGPSAPEGMSD